MMLSGERRRITKTRAIPTAIFAIRALTLSRALTIPFHGTRATRQLECNVDISALNTCFTSHIVSLEDRRLPRSAMLRRLERHPD
ncbi:uncharacterized protein BDW47DRAFT_56111 [Aspergillus candidus]|uniref:Uncharacterized protein n=1 Tax=Aspergillus candidus TaxID=41067 RepID=A0A2I2FLP8_ASPCN|nr:hypothetical protein BDW47DRAFT_56111 [Aspergillus candidus]PLB41551.1 hypothetical protein BDW47DRAFT_56111 [Aspergillus candidus]